MVLLEYLELLFFLVIEYNCSFFLPRCQKVGLESTWLLT